jgi:hypothetical protein
MTSAKGITQNTHFVVAPTHQTHLSPSCLRHRLLALTPPGYLLNNYNISLHVFLFTNIVGIYNYFVNSTTRTDMQLCLLLVTCLDQYKPATPKKPIYFNHLKGRFVVCDNSTQALNQHQQEISLLIRTILVLLEQ